jgi:hypothetical protein
MHTYTVLQVTYRGTDIQGSTDHRDPTVPAPATTLPTHLACKQLQAKSNTHTTMHIKYHTISRQPHFQLLSAADTQGSTDNTDNRATTVPELATTLPAPATTLPAHPACKQLLRQVKHIHDNAHIIPYYFQTTALSCIHTLCFKLLTAAQTFRAAPITAIPPCLRLRPRCRRILHANNCKPSQTHTRQCTYKPYHFQTTALPVTFRGRHSGQHRQHR